MSYKEECEYFTKLAIKTAHNAESELDKIKCLQQAQIYAQIAQAIALGVCYAFDDAVKPEEKSFDSMAQASAPGIVEDIKEPTKEAFENQVCGSEDAPRQPVVTPEEGNKLQEDFTRIAANIQQWLSAGINVTMPLVLHWATQAVGYEVTDLSKDLLHMNAEQSHKFIEYFKKLTTIFNTIGARPEHIAQALAMITQGRYTKTEDMSPDNIDVVIDMFKQSLEAQQKAN